MEILSNLSHAVTKLLLMVPILTACNSITMWMIDYQSKNSLRASIEVSTFPALVANIINQAVIYASKSSNIPYNKFTQYGVMGLYSAFVPKIVLNCLENKVNNIDHCILNNRPIPSLYLEGLHRSEIELIDNKKVIVLILPKVEALQKRIEILKKANYLILIANTVVQTVLIDMIWNGFPWSNDKAQDLSEIEDIKQGLNDLGIEPQDDYYNEYVMAAA